MAVCDTISMDDISSGVACKVCMDYTRFYHTCKHCHGRTCMKCTNDFAYLCYQYGRQPSCAFCYQEVLLPDAWILHNDILRAAEEPQVGDKRERDCELLTDDDDSESRTTLNWAEEDIPPVSWRSYFVQVGLEFQAPINPELILAFPPELGEIPTCLLQLDDPEFFRETDGMITL